MIVQDFCINLLNSEYIYSSNIILVTHEISLFYGPSFNTTNSYARTWVDSDWSLRPRRWWSNTETYLINWNKSESKLSTFCHKYNESKSIPGALTSRAWSSWYGPHLVGTWISDRKSTKDQVTDTFH